MKPHNSKLHNLHKQQNEQKRLFLLHHLHKKQPRFIVPSIFHHQSHHDKSPSPPSYPHHWWCPSCLPSPCPTHERCTPCWQQTATLSNQQQANGRQYHPQNHEALSPTPLQPWRPPSPHWQMKHDHPPSDRLGIRIPRPSYLLQAFLFPSRPRPPHKSFCFQHQCHYHGWWWQRTR
jgi:hypothetical protein